MDIRFPILFCIFLGGLGQGVVNPKLPELLGSKQDLSLDSGISASLMYLGIFLTSFFYGKLCDKGRTLWLMRGGLCAYTLILVLFTMASTMLQIFVLRFFEGLALSAIFVASDVVLCRASPEKERGQWLSYYGIAISLGLLMGPSLLIMMEKLGRLHPLLDSLYLVAFLSISTAFFLSRPLPLLTSSPTGKNHKNYYASASAFLYGFLEAGLVAVLAAVITLGYTMSVESGFILIIICAALASLPWGILIDKAGGRPTLYVVYGLLALGLGGVWLLSTALPKEICLYVAIGLLGSTAGGLYPAAFSWLIEGVSPADYGNRSAHFTRIYGLGSLFGPLIFGLATNFFGARGLFATASLLGFVGFAVTKKASRVKASP